MFPNFSNIEILEEEEDRNLGLVPRYLFQNSNYSLDLKNGRIQYANSIEEKVKIYIGVLLRTEIDKFNIYKGEGFGMSYFHYVGRGDIPFEIVKAEIEREVKEKILKLNEVLSINNFEISLNTNKLNVNFSVELEGSEITIEI